MLPLPHGRVLLVIGWAFIAFTIYGSLNAHGIPMGITVNDKIEHAAGYFLLMVWFAGLYPRNRHWMLGLGLFLLGAILEVLQGTMTATREMDIHDLAANTSGILIAYGLCGFGLANWATRVEAWLTRANR